LSSKDEEVVITRNSSNVVQSWLKNIPEEYLKQKENAEHNQTVLPADFEQGRPLHLGLGAKYIPYTPNQISFEARLKRKLQPKKAPKDPKSSSETMEPKDDEEIGKAEMIRKKPKGNEKPTTFVPSKSQRKKNSKNKKNPLH